MFWAQIVVTWLHVLLAIFWFGGSLYNVFVLGPAVMMLPAEGQLTLYRAMTKRRAAEILEGVGVITVLLGIIRGSLLGPVRSIDFLVNTPYGITWGIALLLAAGVLAWSRFVIQPKSEQFATAAAAGDMVAVRKAAPLLLLELLGFFGIFTCMILMRFGL